MGWRCVRVRRKLALYVGEDLADLEKCVVERHLRECSACHEHFELLRRSREVIVHYRAEPCDLADSPSLWPLIEQRLTVKRPPAPTRSLLPLGAVFAASVAIGIIFWNRPIPMSPLPERDRFDISIADLQESPNRSVSYSSRALQHNPRGEVDRPNDTVPRYHLESAVPVGRSPGEF